MKKYELIFYVTKRGESPVDDFLDSLSIKARAKVMSFIALLEEKGPNLRRPYTGILKEGIRELRIQLSPNHYRLLYFFFLRNRIIFTNGLIKKTDKVSEEEIKKAKRRKNDFVARYKGGEFKL
ncbi:MAG: type II toxin-antitoxin system RelE/ParE family toxin [Candidatus Omnitrophota bacterium]|nr:type II toxin-antitoxin system RelE/ParE family toxin [Candidatus Omnitrophota bacterium]MBU2528822.1 type II toxin-antitoxin system RelE/ParE family toxin [bacterium]MBU3930401.1 type II toxin-antitoxin system RelE/ParE family toxin [bacterium]MBU4123252.1 type II toxin-antitoxin system RelE/ParE family toxin [bacterium]